MLLKYFYGNMSHLIYEFFPVKIIDFFNSVVVYISAFLCLEKSLLMVWNNTFSTLCAEVRVALHSKSRNHISHCV